MASSYRLELNKWLANLDIKAGTVYDVGGSQEKVRDRVKSWQVDNYLVFDLPTPHADSPKPDVEIDLNSGKNDTANGYRGLADAIFCLEVFEYIYRPELALKTLKALLKTGGKLYVSFCTNYPLHNPVEDDALRYQLGGIKKLARVVGLEVVNVVPRRFETNAYLNFCSIERLRPAKGHEQVAGYIVEFTK